ncbi:CPBP family intramembrane glutamic endopeptidase [Jannaschia formosa]|uniref:CPBP family intramembrane glutamic endopeptidase n=1 Tax=Jannaschia formosa TaxID=2259592 RepID=UPI000E1B767D|nr:type II CAAX endopeptidase family protein [Jannaschia formosa]TFL18080.1 CPBP family intramembrane metalloprotease [Jannaschia formosa]
MRLRTPAFDRFVAPARTRPGLGRLVAGFLMIEALFYVAAIVIVAIFRDLLFAPAPGPEGGWTYVSTPLGVVIVLATPALLILWTPWIAGRLQGRRLRDLVGPLDPGLLLGAAAITLGLALLTESFVWTDPMSEGVSLGTLLAWLPVALPVLLLQTGGEELFYRGYLQTQLAARFEDPAIWLGGPALLFALVHVDVWHLATEGHFSGNDGGWLIVLFASGLIAGDLTRVTGGIAAAWGWHFGNNLFAIFLVTFEGPVSGLALYVLPFSAEEVPLDVLTVAQLLMTQVILWAVLRLWLARRGLPE